MTWFVFLYRFGILTPLTFLGAMTYTVRVRFSVLPNHPDAKSPKAHSSSRSETLNSRALPLLQQKIKTGRLGRHHPRPSPSQLCNTGCCIHASSPSQTLRSFLPIPFLQGSAHLKSLCMSLPPTGGDAMEVQIFLPVKEMGSGVGPLWAGLGEGYGSSDVKPSFWGWVHGCRSDSGLEQPSLWKVMLVFAAGHPSRAVIQFHTLQQPCAEAGGLILLQCKNAFKAVTEPFDKQL